MQPLDPSLTDKFKEAEKAVSVISEIIEERITYIIQKVHDTFGVAYENWYMEDARENETAFTSHYLIYDSIGYDTSGCSFPKDAFIIDKNGKKYDFTWNQFPTRWIFEEFEKELEDGRALYVEKKKAKKQKSEEETERLLVSIREKLSPEEFKLLNSSKQWKY